MASGKPVITETKVQNYVDEDNEAIVLSKGQDDGFDQYNFTLSQKKVVNFNPAADMTVDEIEIKGGRVRVNPNFDTKFLFEDC